MIIKQLFVVLLSVISVSVLAATDNVSGKVDGAKVYVENCSICHGDAGDGGGNIPDLAYSSKAKHQNIQKIVREGMLESVGMPNLGNKLTAEEVELIQQYIFAKAKALQTSVAQKSDG